MASSFFDRKNCQPAPSFPCSDGSRSKHVLLVVSDPYIAVQLLRCLHQCKRKARVLDFSASPHLRWSRSCLDYSQAAVDEIRADGPRAAQFLAAMHAERAFGTAIAAGMDATLMLSRSMAYITRFDVQRMMTSDVLERLNDKWQFAGICRALLLPHPDTVLVASADDQLPSWCDHEKAVLKPLTFSGGRGVCILDTTADVRRSIERLQASGELPCIVQRYVAGMDGVLGILAHNGTVVTATLHWYGEDRDSAVFCNEPTVLTIAQKIVAAENLTGIFEFDLRYDPNQRWWITECNPRYWASVGLASFSGINFVCAELALRDLPSASAPALKLPVGEWMRLKEYCRRMRQRGIGSSGAPSAMTLSALRATLRDPILAAFNRFGRGRAINGDLH